MTGWTQVLTLLSDEQHWTSFETALNRQRIRVYDLRPEWVRVDGTTISSYGTVTEEGLLQFGHSKDHRPDLPQLKVRFSTSSKDYPASFWGDKEPA
jgi:transposase